MLSRQLQIRAQRPRWLSARGTGAFESSSPCRPSRRPAVYRAAEKSRQVSRVRTRRPPPFAPRPRREPNLTQPATSRVVVPRARPPAVQPADMPRLPERAVLPLSLLPRDHQRTAAAQAAALSGSAASIAAFAALNGQPIQIDALNRAMSLPVNVQPRAPFAGGPGGSPHSYDAAFVSRLADWTRRRRRSSASSTLGTARRARLRRRP